jgi:alpha-ketoglutarate-dependent 2,4-dichlorophenoxyacetate dioxygenase
MEIVVTPLRPFGAELRGVDLRPPVPPEAFAAIEAAFHEHGFLVFPGQHLADEQQMAFSQLFGPLEIAPAYADDKARTRAEITDVSNVGADDRVLTGDARRRRLYEINLRWHTDSSFKYVPAKCSLLSARELPSEGGETEFADMRAAWEALPDERKQQLEGLVAEHSIEHSGRCVGFDDFNGHIAQQFPPAPQMLVRRHPATGRKNLYIASHISHIVGWPLARGRALLDELIAFATRPRFVHRHVWTVGDLVMWDNRCTMHRGRPYDQTQRRVLHRTTVSDAANTVDAVRQEVRAELPSFYGTLRSAARPPAAAAE